MKLRDYQVGLIECVKERLNAGVKRQLLYLPTGGGKTIVASELISDYVGNQKRCLFVVRHEPLIPQTVKKLKAFGVNCGVIKGGYKPELNNPVQVATIQSMNRRKIIPDADLVIVDEAHGACASQYDVIWDNFKGELLLGLSATPFRLGKKESLADRFDQIVGSIQTKDLIEQGYLVPIQVFSHDKNKLDLSTVSMVAGDYNEKELAIKCDTPQMISALVAEYRKKADGTRAIAFAINIQHSKHITEAFNAAGIAAEHLDGNTPPDERQKIYRRLRKGKTLVVSSVGVLSEGFDEPCVETGLMARPTASHGLFLQQVGRILRPSEETAKQKATLIDQAGNTWRFGLPTEKIELSFALPFDSETFEPPVKKCPECDHMMHTAVMDCPNCGYHFEPESLAIEPLEELVEVSQGYFLEMFIKRLIRQRKKLGKPNQWVMDRFLDLYPNPSAEVLEQLRRSVSA